MGGGNEQKIASIPNKSIFQEMNKEIIHDIIAWDVVNWSKAIAYWERELEIKAKNLDCLELGAAKGGCSLWLALHGNRVICSDLISPFESAFEIHKKYDCRELITYDSINATEIPYENKFDIVVFKSILGGITRKGSGNSKKQVIDEVYRAIKPGGKLIFAENLEASYLHRFMRKKFVRWGGEWNYLKYHEVNEVFGSFSSLKYKTAGFFGTFGRTEKQRHLLGWLDNLFNVLIPKSTRYILIGIAEK